MEYIKPVYKEAFLNFYIEFITNSTAEELKGDINSVLWDEYKI
jgi:hypothetical protein